MVTCSWYAALSLHHILSLSLLSVVRKPPLRQVHTDCYWVDPGVERKASTNRAFWEDSRVGRTRNLFLRDLVNNYPGRICLM